MAFSLTWYGHSAFKLATDDSAVLIDPFITGNPAATVDAVAVDAPTILLTHAHNDHVGDTVSIATRNDSTVIATFELANFIGSRGVERTIGGNHGGTIQFEGGWVKFVPAWHTSSYETADGVVAPGVPAGLVVRFGGVTSYFAGDTCLFLDMQLIADEDLALAVLPIGDTFTMGPADAARAAGILKVTTVVPCHYNTFPAIQQDANAFRESVEATTDSRVEVLLPGGTVQIG